MTLHEMGSIASSQGDASSVLADGFPAVLFRASSDGQMTWFSRRWYELTGTDGARSADEAWRSSLYASEIASTAESWRALVARGVAFAREFRCRFADGAWHSILLKAEPVRDHTGAPQSWLGTIAEIDDLKEVEHALLKSELRFRALTDNIEQVIFIADADWNVTYLNRRYEEYTGVPVTQALGAGWVSAVPDDELDFIRAELRAAAETRMLSHEHRLYHAQSGTYRWNLIRAHQVTDMTGRDAQWFGTITDIHDQKTALERKNRALDAFQLALLPRQIAQIAHCGVSTLYVSASEEARVGGDWYDVFELEEDRFGISIGDVVGHGLEASAAMSRIRQYISAAAEDGCTPSAVMERTNRFIIRRRLPLATAVFGIYDARSRQFTMCSAGHPSPIVVRGDRAEQISCSGLALGVDDHAEFDECVTDLSDASLLALYTDGVLEFRRDLLSAERSLLVGAAVTARLRNPASRAAEIVRRAMGNARATDDIAMLVLAFDEEGTGTVSHRLETLMSWQFDSHDPQAVYRVREQVLLFLTELACPDQELFEVKAVLGELIANAVEHAPGPVHLEVDWSEDRAVLRMRDHGPGFTARVALPGDVMSESGRGLFLIAALADDLRAASHFEGGTEVSVRLRLHKHSPA